MIAGEPNCSLHSLLICLEVHYVHRIKANQRDKQADVGLSEAVAGNVPPA